MAIDASPAATVAYVDSANLLSTLLLCGLMGLVGQGVRSILGLKNVARQDQATPDIQSSFNAAYLMVSLMIGFIAGIVSGIGIGLGNLSKFDPTDIKILLGIAAAGYAGTDFIENAFSSIIPGLGPSGATSASNRAAAGQTKQISAATHLQGSGQTVISADDVIDLLKTQRAADGAAVTAQAQAAVATVRRNWSTASLQRDMGEALKYAASIRSAATQHDFSPSLVCAIGSRESRWGLSPDMKPSGPTGTGDWKPRKGVMPPDNLGWGRGLMQIDYAAFDFAKDASKWQDPDQNIHFACNLLAQNRSLLGGKHPELEPDQLLRATVAAYNTGAGNVNKSLNAGKDVDSTTAGGDYSQDVLSRAAWFEKNGFNEEVGSFDAVS